MRNNLLATKDSSDGLRIVAWNHDERIAIDENGNPQVKETVEGECWELVLRADDARTCSGWVESILPGEGSAYETWLAAGSPANLTPELTSQLNQASVPRRAPIEMQDGILRLQIPAGSTASIIFPI